MVYLIAYDIKDNLYDYSNLLIEIKSIGNSYQHPMGNLWFVRTDDEDIKGISTRLRSCLNDPKDHLYVMEVPSDSRRKGWLPKSFWSWLRNENND